MIKKIKIKDNYIGEIYKGNNNKKYKVVIKKDNEKIKTI